MIEETSAGVVLFRKENSKILFLLLHYPSGHWDFVKGKNGKRRINSSNSNKRNKRRDWNYRHYISLDNFEEWIEYNFQYKGELVHKKVVFFLGRNKRLVKLQFLMSILDFTWMDYNTCNGKNYV